MSVYTSLDAGDITRFLAAHSQGELVEFSGIAAGIENTNYFVTTKLTDANVSTREFVLTVFETTPATNLESYFKLMADLANHQLPAAEPLKNRNGSYLSELKSKPAALIKRLPGKSVEQPTASHCARVGEFLASMHTMPSNNREKIENFRGSSWRESIIDKLAGHCPHADIKFLKESHYRMRDFERTMLPKGNVHGDLFHDNALFVADKLTGVIDFYYAHHAAYIYDLAVTFADWCFVQNKGEIHTENALSMLSTYRRLRALSAREIELWPAAVELASLRFLLSRLHDKYFPRAGSLTQEKDPLIFRQLLDKSQHDVNGLISLLAPKQ